MPPAAAQLISALIAGLAALALGAQGVVVCRMPELGTVSATVWRMAGYFTVLTNLLVALQFAAFAAGSRITARRAGGLVLWTGMVGIVYHLILADLWAPQGLGWWADQGLHTATPVLTALWWLRFAPKAGLGLRDGAGWMIWPLGYCAYAMTRGAATGFWPYPFLDAGNLGIRAVVANMAGLVLAFAALGLVVLGLARLMRP